MRTLPAIALALWLGAMGFFAFLVAPAAFGALEREAAGRFVALIFPRYCLLGTALGLLALAGCVARGALGGWRLADGMSAGLVLLMLALTAYAWGVVLPAAHGAREAMRGSPDAAGAALRFARLHRLSGVLNAIVMVAGAVGLAMEVMRRP
jgi:uncharacterized membrane protein